MIKTSILKNFIKLATIILLCLVPDIGYAQFSKQQQNEIDSLNSIISNPQSHDTSVAKSYLGLSEILYISKLDTIIFLCEKTEKIAEKGLKERPSVTIERSLKSSLAGALNNIGYVHKQKGRISLALSYHQRSMKLKKEIGDKKGLATSYNNIGIIYKGQGDIPLALEYYHKGLRIEEEIGNKKGIATSYNNIGVIHNNQKDYPLALEYYKKSLQICEESKNLKGIALSYNNIGMIYFKQAEFAEKANQIESRDSLYDLTFESYQKCLKLRLSSGDEKGMAICYMNLGGLYNAKKEMDIALEYFNKSLKIKQEKGLKKGESNILASIGNLYFEQGNLKLAKTTALNGLEIAQEIGYPDQIKRNASLLSKIAEMQGDYKLAFEMQGLKNQMKDSLNNEKSLKSIVKQQDKYEYDKQNALNELSHQKELEKQSLIAQKENEHQQLITYFAFGGAGLILLFLIFIFNRLNITRKQKELIGVANEELNQTNEEILAHRDEIENQKIQVEAKNREITSSIAYAKRIQEAILPPIDTLNKNLKNGFVLYKPKDVVAGDFYWSEKIDDKVLFAVADCTGHGVPGAMVSVVCNGALNRSIREYKLTKPSEILNKTRELVVSTFEKSIEQVKDGMDISLCCIKNNEKGDPILEYAGANNPIYLIRNNEVEIIKANRQPIGFVDDYKPFTNHTIELQKGDTIYLFTDGFADQFGGEKDRKFSYRRFRELLLSIQNKSMDEQNQILELTLNNWMKQSTAEQLDDVCVMGVRI